MVCIIKKQSTKGYRWILFYSGSIMVGVFKWDSSWNSPNAFRVKVGWNKSFAKHPQKKKKNPTNQLKRYVRTYVSNCKKGIQKNTKKLFNRSFGLEQHTLGSLRNEKWISANICQFHFKFSDYILQSKLIICVFWILIIDNYNKSYGC